jgi:hypothetical protein
MARARQHESTAQRTTAALRERGPVADLSQQPVYLISLGLIDASPVLGAASG